MGLGRPHHESHLLGRRPASYILRQGQVIRQPPCQGHFLDVQRARVRRTHEQEHPTVDVLQEGLQRVPAQMGEKGYSIRVQMFEKASGISPGRTGDVSTFDVQNHRTQGLEPRHQALQSGPTRGPPNFEEGRVDLEGDNIRGCGLGDAQAEALCPPGRGLREHLGMRVQARHEEASTLPNPLFQAGKERGFHHAHLSLTSHGLPEGQYNVRRRTQGRR